MENIKGMERLSDGALAAVAGGSGGDGDELYPAVQSLCSRTRQTVLRIGREPGDRNGMPNRTDRLLRQTEVPENASRQGKRSAAVSALNKQKSEPESFIRMLREPLASDAELPGILSETERVLSRAQGRLSGE